MPDQFVSKSHAEEVSEFRQLIYQYLVFVVGKEPMTAQPSDWLDATLLAVRERLVGRWFDATRTAYSQDVKRVYYLSLEFLMGRALNNALQATALFDVVKDALDEMNIDVQDILNEEPDAALGNGGLGRLAACFLDSLATRNLPALGYGIRYNYGMFKQQIVDGKQVELPDNWLNKDYRWEFQRPDSQYLVRFAGQLLEEQGKVYWTGGDIIYARAYDHVIPGFETSAANTLRLWSAKADNAFDLSEFNKGDYFAAVEDKEYSENISRVLYPDDSTHSGKELRLRQEYFFVSASLQDIIRRHFVTRDTLDNFAEKNAIHLNDTHPVLAIPELMRLLIDDYDYAWDKAWEITQKTFSYTNHTLMQEALETWPVEMLKYVLPRHLRLIFEINEYHLSQVRTRLGNDPQLLQRLSLIDEPGERKVRMAYLAVVGSHKVNGVSELHSNLMVESIFSDFATIFPDRFCNITNGITPRRWLSQANPHLSAVIDEKIGRTWRTNLTELSGLNAYADFALFSDQVRKAKLNNKKRLASYVADYLGEVINPQALFDVQIKRIHEYKRQLLNVLHVITLYHRLLDNPDSVKLPRVKIFAGKAASAYAMAKKIIHLINDISNTVNQNKRVRDKLKVIFIPDYGVSIAEIIIPATNLSEQISLAGTEASGTGNMKFALNGALTIGTLDGANIEIKNAVGEENIFIFGNTAEQVALLRAQGYDPRRYISEDKELSRALDAIRSGVFCPEEPNRYGDIYDNLVNWGDYYQLAADYKSYIDTQDRVDKCYLEPTRWANAAIANIAGMGYFSSDRTVQEYADKIWDIKPIKLARH